MNLEKELQDAFERLKGNGETIFPASVVSVDKDKGTCVVNEGDLELTDVRLSAAIAARESWCYFFPLPESTVLVSTIGGAMENLMVLAVSDVEEFHLKHDTTEVITNADGVHIKRGGEDLSTLLGELIDTINKITVTTSAGPSGTPINAAAFAAIKSRLETLII